MTRRSGSPQRVRSPSKAELRAKRCVRALSPVASAPVDQPVTRRRWFVQRRVFATAGQEAFFEDHVHAFQVLCGIQRAHTAMTTCWPRSNVCWASTGPGGDRRTAFRSHWGIEPFHCRPGIEGAHEKGGVEGQIGYYRRNHFRPVPEGASLTELGAAGAGTVTATHHPGRGPRDPAARRGPNAAATARPRGPHVEASGRIGRTGRQRRLRVPGGRGASAGWTISGGPRENLASILLEGVDAVFRPVIPFCPTRRRIPFPHAAGRPHDRKGI
ncbi:hypothetical protein SALBM311S_09871 [Streptomyces alboniger]